MKFFGFARPTVNADSCGCNSSPGSCSSTSQTPQVSAEAASQRVLLHPELTDNPAELSWVITSYPWDLSAVVDHPDSTLQKLVSLGVLRAAVGGAGVVRTLAPSREAWKDCAGLVRRALEDTVHAALLAAVASEGDASEASAHSHLAGIDDERLRHIAPSILERYVRPLAGAHGGKIEITKIADGRIWVYLDGACRGCPAAAFTLQQRFERELNRRVPGARVLEQRASRH